MRYLKLAKHSKSSYKELKFVKLSVQRLFYHFMSSSLRFVEHTALKTLYLFTIRHSAEVARVKIEKLKRIPILHNSNGTDQRVLQVYQCIIFSVEQLDLLNSQNQTFFKKS